MQYSSLLPLVFGFILPTVAVNYTTERAFQFAHFAGAAYCPLEDLKTWSCGYKCIPGVTSVEVCSGWGTNAFVGKFEGGCIASFEGTTPAHYKSFIDDFMSAKVVQWAPCGDNCTIGAGWLKEWDSLKQCVMAGLRTNGCAEDGESEVRTAGHSLGAATANLAMMELKNAGWNIVESYDFGKPRVGDTNWATKFNKMFEGQSWRVTRLQDPVPQLPPNNNPFDPLGLNDFQHTEPEMYYKDIPYKGYETCTDARAEECVEEHPHAYLNPMDISDHTHYFEINTGHHGCGDPDPPGAAVVV